MSMEKATAANDPQCSNCTYAHHNMAGQFGEGWCYLFRNRMEGCNQKKVQPGATVAPSQKDLDAVKAARLKRERRTQKKAQQAQKE